MYYDSSKEVGRTFEYQKSRARKATAGHDTTRNREKEAGVSGKAKAEFFITLPNSQSQGAYAMQREKQVVM